MKKLVYCLSFLTITTFAAKAQTVIPAKDAAKHIGETVTITAQVFGGKSFASGITLLDLGGDNPKQELTLMIPAADKNKFKGQSEAELKGKDVKITGKLVDFKGKPEIVVNDPKQLKVVLMDNIVPIKAQF